MLRIFGGSLSAASELNSLLAPFPRNLRSSFRGRAAPQQREE
jgi:hypothetical protein